MNKNETENKKDEKKVINTNKSNTNRNNANRNNANRNNPNRVKNEPIKVKEEEGKTVFLQPTGSSRRPMRRPMRKPVKVLDAKIDSASYKTNKKNSMKGLKIIPLGGLEKIGMNITAIEYEDSIIVIDCGISFPEDNMLGIDLVIPDVTYLKDNIHKVKGFVLTHGHEDHLGALPYILRDVNVPVYGTKLTLAILENKLKEHNLLKNTRRKVVKHGQSINLGCFRIEFIRINHSIADASSLAIYSPGGTIFHTGDFKVDYTPVFGKTIDLQRIAEIGKKGVLAMLCDSTNAGRPGYTISEREVGKTFDNIFSENKKQRIIVATFASNVDRIQQIIALAEKYGRKVIVEGRSMVNIVGIAEELGYIKIPKGMLINVREMRNYPDDQIVLITTGSQGEAMAALSRMAASIHRQVSIKPGDVVILSSTPIPGNEKAVSKVINELSRKGANVINEDTHVSGHAHQEEIKLMYALIQPQYVIPVHGEYRHLIQNAKIARSMGIANENIKLISSGDVLTVNKKQAAVTGKVPAQGILVDGLGVGDVGNVVLRDRQHLSEDGLISVVVTIDKASNTIVAGPDIVSRGFVYVKESEDLIEESKRVVEEALEKCMANSKYTDWGKMKSVIKDALSNYIWNKTKRNPMILPIIMEV